MLDGGLVTARRLTREDLILGIGTEKDYPWTAACILADKVRFDREYSARDLFFIMVCLSLALDISEDGLYDEKRGRNVNGGLIHGEAGVPVEAINEAAPFYFAQEVDPELRRHFLLIRALLNPASRM